jgi:hypothetical protein
MYLCPRLLIDMFGRERREHRVFEQLLESYPSLLERIKNGSEEEILHVGDLVRRSLHGPSSCLRFIDRQGSCRREM